MVPAGSDVTWTAGGRISARDVFRFFSGSERVSYLHQRRGSVVERSALLRDVWGYDYAGGSNVIEANVRSLRRKLGDRAGSIETVRGLGYRFGGPG